MLLLRLGYILKALTGAYRWVVGLKEQEVQWGALTGREMMGKYLEL